MGFDPLIMDIYSTGSSDGQAGPAPQDVPGAAPPSPGFFTLFWRTITGQDQGLFSCRPDSLVCGGTGHAVTSMPGYKPAMNLDFGPAIIIAVIILFGGLFMLRKVTS